MAGCIQQALTPFIVSIADAFERRGTAVYAVGGAVRNALMSLPPHDWDIASALPPRRAVGLAREAGFNAALVNERLGTVLIRRGEEQVEHTTFRTESYGDGGTHAPQHVAFVSSLDEDARRRDFSINALYYRIAHHTLLDPTGGLADLESRRLRTTSRDPVTIFRDDGLRLLRLVRFACELGLTIEDNTWRCARAHAPLIADVTPERSQAELARLFVSDTAYPGLSSPPLRAAELLLDSGLLAQLLPELMEGEGIAQKTQYHAYDVLHHALHAYAAAPPDVTLRLCALLHDVGKPTAQRQGGRMIGHDAIGAEMAEAMLRRLRYPTRQTAEIAAMIRHHMFDLDGRAKESTVRLRIARWGTEHMMRLAQLRRADVWGSGRMHGRVATADRWERLAQDMRRDGSPVDDTPLAVNGHDILEKFPQLDGRTVGVYKEALFRYAVLHPGKNTREALLGRLQTLSADMRYNS